MALNSDMQQRRKGLATELSLSAYMPAQRHYVEETKMAGPSLKKFRRAKKKKTSNRKQKEGLDTDNDVGALLAACFEARHFGKQWNIDNRCGSWAPVRKHLLRLKDAPEHIRRRQILYRRNSAGSTSLHLALSGQAPADIVFDILQMGGETLVRIGDSSVLSPLCLAARCCHDPEIVRRIIRMHPPALKSCTQNSMMPTSLHSPISPRGIALMRERQKQEDGYAGSISVAKVIQQETAAELYNPNRHVQLEVLKVAYRCARVPLHINKLGEREKFVISCLLEPRFQDFRRYILGYLETKWA